jgi:hypothetical protein
MVNYQNFYLATLALHFHRFIKKYLSDCPVDAIRMAVSFPYSYVDSDQLANRKINEKKTFSALTDDDLN